MVWRRGSGDILWPGRSRGSCAVRPDTGISRRDLLYGSAVSPTEPGGAARPDPGGEIMARTETGAGAGVHGLDRRPAAPIDPRFPLPAGPASGPAAVTVVLVVRNEERNIGPCLSRLSWADRILLVDDGSTDATISIASRYTRWILPGVPQPG